MVLGELLYVRQIICVIVLNGHFPNFNDSLKRLLVLQPLQLLKSKVILGDC